MTINELIQVAHADAKAKGWWDEERNIGEALMLIVSECGEALEAHRNGRMGDLQQFDARYPERNCQLSEEASLSLFRSTFEDYIKDSFFDKLADIVIRIADLAGAHVLSLPVPDKVEQLAGVCSHKNVGNAPLGVVRSVSSVGNFDNTASDEERLAAAIIGVFSIAADHNIDLWRHIELKLTYNRTRSYRHSKAY